MSSKNSNSVALQKINTLLGKYPPDLDTNINIVLSLPRSDMGKGSVVAHLLANLEDSDAIKFDGLLNTNVNGRHTAAGHDDFGIYEQYNPKKKFGEEKYILGGDLFKEFIELYGEYENLSFRPHFTRYFLSKLGEIWNDIGRPKNLIFEVGGTISDWEVDPYITPAITYLKSKYGSRCRVILLSEIAYNNEYIKTKTVQTSVLALLERMIIPDFVLFREPAELKVRHDSERMEFESTVAKKLLETLGSQFMPRNILSIPFYEQGEMDKLGEYINRRLIPFLK